MIRLLRHDDSVSREEDGPEKIEDLASIFRSRMMSSSQWSIRTWLSFLQRGGGIKKRFQYCVNPNSLETFLYLRAIQGHSGGTHIELHCKTGCCCRATSPSTSITLEAPMTCTPLSSLDSFRVGKCQERDARGVLYGRKSDVRRSAQRSRVRPDEFQNCSAQKSLESIPKYSVLV